jgi:hypothetical protein
MTKNRLETFSEGVFAIVITLPVLELRPKQAGLTPRETQPKGHFTRFKIFHLDRSQPKKTCRDDEGFTGFCGPTILPIPDMENTCNS